MKYSIFATTDIYQRYVIEAEDEDQATDVGVTNFKHLLETMVDNDISVEVTRVDDDTPLGNF